MKSTIKNVSDSASRQLTEIGLLIKQQRKSFKITANATSESAGISRVTLHRIEKGEPSVSICAYLNVMSALNLTLFTGEASGVDADAKKPVSSGWLPARIALAEYPQLKELAWHIQGVDHLSPIEAHSIYERNKRFLEIEKLSNSERDLISSLRIALEGAVL
jgi:transcriptional regulator with XRE-family HTH domain